MRLRRAILPAVLAVTALATGTAAAVQERVALADGEPLGGPVAVTPVLSVRRLPTVVAAPVADRRLRADLAAWAGSAPAPSCATVVDPEGDLVLAQEPTLPLVPASTTKLLTAAAALHVLGPEHVFRTVVH
ncbi:MAG: D-alanyl-D-alanine carboxypeptidase, partial [Actinomycetota bacterium]